MIFLNHDIGVSMALGLTVFASLIFYRIDVGLLQCFADSKGMFVRQMISMIGILVEQTECAFFGLSELIWLSTLCLIVVRSW